MGPILPMSNSRTFSVFITENFIYYRGSNNGQKTSLFLIQITSKYQKLSVLTPFIFYIKGKIDACEGT